MACTDMRVINRGERGTADNFAAPAPQPTVPSASTVSSGVTGSSSEWPTSFGSTVDPPVASEHFVFAVSPKGGAVAVLDATSRGIETVPTGDSPSRLAVIPGQDACLVLNTGDDTVSIIRVESLGKITTTTIDLPAGTNAIAVAPDGETAVAYFNADLLTDANFGDFQGVSLLSLTPGKESSSSVVVGYKPSVVRYTADSRKIVVVTEVGISLIDPQAVVPAGSGIATSLAFTDGYYSPSQVMVSPDGAYVVGLAVNPTRLSLIDTVNGSPSLDLALNQFLKTNAKGQVTDDGTNLPAESLMGGMQCVATPQGSAVFCSFAYLNAILRVPVPAGFTDPTAIERHLLPAAIDAILTPLSETQVSVAAYGYPYLIAMDFAVGGADTTIQVRKMIHSVVASPDRGTLIVDHLAAWGDPAAPGISADVRVDRSNGFTLLHPSNGDLKLQLTRSPVSQVVFDGDSDGALLLFNSSNDSVREAIIARLTSFSVSNPLGFDTPPVAGGDVAGAGNAFVLQGHSAGRISYIDWASGDIETVTGFGLNNRIRN